MTTYAEYRDRIKTGDIIATSHHSWKSWKDFQTMMVRVFTKSEFSHNAVVWKTNGRVLVIEAVVPQVKITPLSEFAKDGFYIIHLKQPMSAAESTFALSKVGEKYSKWEAIKSFFHKLKIGVDSFWECSELVIACRRLSGIDLGPTATPSAVVQAALDQGYELHYIKG